ncbi:DUF1686 domain-containing protein, partial [Encephalitozoon intestinalis]
MNHINRIRDILINLDSQSSLHEETVAECALVYYYNAVSKFLNGILFYEEKLNEVLESLNNKLNSQSEKGINAVKETLDTLRRLKETIQPKIECPFNQLSHPPELTNIEILEYNFKTFEEYFKAIDRMVSSEGQIPFEEFKDALRNVLPYVDYPLTHSTGSHSIVLKNVFLQLLGEYNVSAVFENTCLNKYYENLRIIGRKVLQKHFESLIKSLVSENWKNEIEKELSALEREVSLAYKHQRKRIEQGIQDARAVLNSLSQDVTELQDEYERIFGLLIRSEISLSDAFETMQEKVSNFDDHMCDLEKKIKDIETAFQPILLSKESHKRSLPEDSFLKNIYLVLIIVLCIQGVLWYTDNEKSSAGTV